MAPHSPHGFPEGKTPIVSERRLDIADSFSFRPKKRIMGNRTSQNLREFLEFGSSLARACCDSIRSRNAPLRKPLRGNEGNTSCFR